MRIGIPPIREMGAHPVRWTADPRRASMQHMGVDHRRVDVAMAQQLLNGANVGAASSPCAAKECRKVWQVGSRSQSSRLLWPRLEGMRAEVWTWRQRSIGGRD
jgi:hypothetical protein